MTGTEQNKKNSVKLQDMKKKKLTPFLNTSNEFFEKEIRKTVSFPKALKCIEHKTCTLIPIKHW